MMIANRNSEKPRVYFAHSMLFYNSSIEAGILKELREKYCVLCPNNDIGKLPEFSRYLKIVEWADAVVAHEFYGAVTMGVFNEVTHALNLSIPVWCVRKIKGSWAFFKVIHVEFQPVEQRVNQHCYGKLILNADDSPVQQSIN